MRPPLRDEALAAPRLRLGLGLAEDFVVLGFLALGI
jgi:hypothetical protein